MKFILFISIFFALSAQAIEVGFSHCSVDHRPPWTSNFMTDSIYDIPVGTTKCYFVEHDIVTDTTEVYSFTVLEDSKKIQFSLRNFANVPDDANAGKNCMYEDYDVSLVREEVHVVPTGSAVMSDSLFDWEGRPMKIGFLFHTAEQRRNPAKTTFKFCAGLEEKLNHPFRPQSCLSNLCLQSRPTAYF